MRGLLTTTAVALLATPVLAQDGGIFQTDLEIGGQDIYASSFVNQTVYATETEVMADMRFAEDELTAVGEVDDVIMTQEGEVKGVVLGVGGVLDIGEKNVLVHFDDINFVQAKGDTDEYFVVLQTTAEQVEDAPTFEYPDAMMWWGG
jgi:hypothetical protein